MISCPNCQSKKVKLNGHIHNGKQNYACKSCGRQFVLKLENKVITEKDKSLINKLLLEKIYLAGIARTIEVSEVYLQGYISDLFVSLEDKFEQYIYSIAPSKKTLVLLSL